MLTETSQGRKNTVGHYREIATNVMAAHGLLRTAANVKSGKKSLTRTRIQLRRHLNRIDVKPPISLFKYWKTHPRHLQATRAAEINADVDYASWARKPAFMRKRRIQETSQARKSIVGLMRSRQAHALAQSGLLRTAAKVKTGSLTMVRLRKRLNKLTTSQRAQRSYKMGDSLHPRLRQLANASGRILLMRIDRERATGRNVFRSRAMIRKERMGK